MSVRRLAVAVAVVCAAMCAPTVVNADADLNHDGRVDVQDLELLLDGWKRFKQGLGQWQGADVNADGTMDYRDARLFIDAFILGVVPSVRLADYWVATPGDMKLWQDTEGLIWTQEQTTAADFEGAVELHVMDMFGRPASLGRTAWGVQQGKVRSFMGWYMGPTFFEVAPPGQGLLIPETLTVGVPVQQDFEVFVGPDRVAHGTMTLVLRGINETVQTPVGTFDNCVRLETRVQWASDFGPEQGSFAALTWMAPGIGAVKRDDDPDNPGQKVTVLGYAKVGTDEFGQRPTADVSQVFPCAAGDLYLWRSGTQVYGMRALAPRNISGALSVPLSELELPLGSSATYWVLQNGFVRGFSGWADPTGDFVMTPPFVWPANLQLGDVTFQRGNVAHGGDAAYGTYSATCALVGVNKTVETPAGRFDGCLVLAVSIYARRQADEIFTFDQRVWFKPGVGPVNVEDFEMVTDQFETGYRRTPLPLVFLRSGNTTYGTQPAADYAELLKLAAGSCWRLQTDGGDWQVRTVAGTAGVNGTTAWRVMRAQAPAGALLDEVFSLLYATSATAVSLVAYEPDPDELGAPTTVVADPAIAVARPMLMGEPYDFDVRLVRTDTGEQIGTLRGTAMYVGDRDIQCPMGTFAGARCVQWYFEQRQGQETDITRWTELYDDAAGIVAVDEEELSAQPPTTQRWRAVWARSQAGTWGAYPGSFDLADLWPLQTGNVWRYGQSNQYTHYEVQAQTTVGNWQDVFPLAYWESQRPSEVDIKYWAVQAARRLLVAYKPSDYPRTVFYQDPMQWPKPWPVGVAAVADTALYDPQQQATRVPVRHVTIPVDAGIDVDTPAGRFTNCVRVVRLNIYDLSPLGQPVEWFRTDMLLAPGVGPVSIQNREKGENAYWGPGELFYALVGGTQYGQP